MQCKPVKHVGDQDRDRVDVTWTEEHGNILKLERSYHDQGIAVRSRVSRKALAASSPL